MDVAEETGGFLMEAMWTWFLPAIRKAKEWVDAGRIGKIAQIQDAGYVAIPDFWRATECQLWVLDDMVDRYEDGRSINGFNYLV
jgi:predicted dehydrogenase